MRQKDDLQKILDKNYYGLENALVEPMNVKICQKLNHKPMIDEIA